MESKNDIPLKEYIPVATTENGANDLATHDDTLPTKAVDNTLEEGKKDVTLNRELGLFSAVSLILGVMIGSGIFVSPAPALSYSGSVGMCTVVWFVCGVISLIGALAFAELGTVVPRSGAEYAYFTESFNNLHPFWGPLPAFICSWVYVVVLRPAEVAVITLTFAEYICQPVIDHYHIDKNSIENVKMYIALGALGLITFINIASVKLYVKIQNIFGAFKVLVCVVIIGAGIYAISTGYTDNLKTGFKGTHTKPSSIALAFYSGLWAYDGWSTVTTVTEEIKNPSRNIPLSILISVPLVTLLYVFMNVAYMAVLTIGEMEAAPAVAVVFGERILGTFSVIIPIGVALATFGCALSIQFSITRLCYVAGQEGHMIKAFSYVNVKRLTPAPAVAFQGLISLIFIMCGSIVTLIEFASFFIWIFYGVAMVSLIVLRYTKPGVHRPYKVPIWIPYFIFLVALFLSVTPIATDPSPKYLFALAFIISGIFVYIPFVYYKMKLPLMDHFTKLIQVVFQAVPPEKYENQNNVDNVDNEKTKADKK
ncbi:b(0,+)-type amino acid transporter 1-like [Chrysoperla carnea]|uniref:b(0,+)-type amino acid transporter 1-like n=1 Tax=Chrysoperla carnea TaxID=189513 RepID=UPI001D093FAD|nr:b(0,+)-type amino acid transporter 1-like [Chrysoperla carnea]